MSRTGSIVAADVMNVAVFKTTHDLHDRVHFADVAEKLVAEPFARARAFDQPGDIDKLDRGRRRSFSNAKSPRAFPVADRAR